MGENLVLNMESKGFTVAVFNRTVAKVDKFVDGRGKGKNFIAAHSIEELCRSLKRPRKVMLLVKAGQAVDDFIEQLIPFLEAGDVIIDGGNTHFPDTVRRTKYVESKGLLYIGTGVSGGEEGALNGPSMMPGGSKAAWELVKPIFQSVCAQADGMPCCDWVGEDGAGHFVKMVHNGIEYGDMQLIGETYQMMKELLGLSNLEMHEVFKEWNEGELDSYLIEITRDILACRDEEGEFVIDRILDTAGQKGTGKWTGINALDFGIPLTLITESVFARCVSAFKDQRVAASQLFGKTVGKVEGDKNVWIEAVRKALLASKIISYAQGFMLIREASENFNWNINYGNTALLWREGCIIRSRFLGNIRDAYEANPDLVFLGSDSYFKGILENAMGEWRKVVAKSIEVGIPMPCMASAITFLDGYTSARLPANLLQAQRDYFGAHTYERTDKPRGEFFHTNWTGKGGDTASTTYDI